MRKISFIVSLLLIFSILFVSCGTVAETTMGDNDETTTAPESEAESDKLPEVNFVENTYVLKDSESLYKKLGRAYVSNEALCLNPSAAGFEFHAVCKGDVVVKVSNATQNNRFMILVDGVKTEHFKTGGAGEYTIATDLPEGKHTIRIVNENNHLSIESVTMVGEMQRPIDSEIYIEIIGDSVAEGAGLYENSNCHTKAFGYLAMEALGVDYGYCARGGTAICYASANNMVIEDLYTLQDKILKTDSVSYTPIRTPDLVIVELSQNDDWQWYSGKIQPDGTEGTQANKNKTDGHYNYEDFDAAFDNLIELIYETNGSCDIPILFVFGCMTANAYHVASDRAKSLVDQYVANGYDFKQVTLTTNRDGLSGHPTDEAAAKQAEELIDFLIEEYPEFIF